MSRNQDDRMHSALEKALLQGLESQEPDSAFVGEIASRFGVADTAVHEALDALRDSGELTDWKVPPTTPSGASRGWSRRSVFGRALAVAGGVALLPALRGSAQAAACGPQNLALKKFAEEKAKQHKQKTEEQYQKFLSEEGTKNADEAQALWNEQRVKLAEEHKKTPSYQLSIREQQHKGQSEHRRKAWRQKFNNAATVPLWIDFPDGSTVEGVIDSESVTGADDCEVGQAIGFDATIGSLFDSPGLVKELVAKLSSLQGDPTTGEAPTAWVQFGDTADLVFQGQLVNFAAADVAYKDGQPVQSRARFEWIWS